MKYLILYCSLSLCCFYLSGCGSIAKGVTEAVLEHQEPENKRECSIKGDNFTGITKSLDSQKDDTADDKKVTKVLMIHGISQHMPGYSTQFKEKLVTKLGLDVESSSYKEIKIQHTDIIDEDTNTTIPLGIMRITRHTNDKKTKELLFYELTWSSITDPERAQIAFDNSAEFSSKRAPVNNTIKALFNSTLVDLMAYRGTGREKINAAVAQSVCWTLSGEWEDLQSEETRFCDITNNDFSQHAMNDDYFFVTHSLGSHILIDTLSLTTSVAAENNSAALSENAKKLFASLKKKNMTVFMLSNQLPLLQLGQETPDIIDQDYKYCEPGSTDYDDRIFNKLNIIAFSDPNDILSYTLPSRYIEDTIDSRLCPKIVNVNINVTDVQDTFGIEFANPATAHTGYQKDDTVISLISDGLSRDAINPTITDKCKWTKTRD